MGKIIVKDGRRVREGGISFWRLIPFLSIDFLSYLLQDKKNILKAFDITDKAADSFIIEIDIYLKRYVMQTGVEIKVPFTISKLNKF